jgi:hypothetical protein
MKPAEILNFKILIAALLCCSCSVFALAAGGYRTAEVDSLRITLDSEWCNQASPGYWPIRLEITNFGQDRVIEFYGNGVRYWSMGPSCPLNVRQLIPLKKSDHVKLTIPIPIFAENENIQLIIREHGRTLQQFGYSSIQSNKMGGALIIADSLTPFGAIAGNLLRTVSPGRITFPPSGGPIAYPSGYTGSKLDFILDPARIPSNWIGLTSLMAIFISSKEWEKLAEAQKEALLNWTASGGEFICVDGDFSTLIPDSQMQPSNWRSNRFYSFPSHQTASYYFGHIHLLQSSEVFKSSPPGAVDYLLREIYNTPGDNDRSLPANRASGWTTFSKQGFRLPIPGIEGPPVRSYLGILILFSLLIGPVNYVWLLQKRRQVLFVLTAPIISVVFILLLAGYAVLGEGLGISGRIESFTLLDQKTNRAATRASVSMYAAGMAPGNGLQFSRNVAVYPVGLDGHGSRDQQMLDLTELQQFSSGLAKARSPINFEEISFRPARERLSFHHANGGITVVNALGATLTRLFYRDGEGLFSLTAPLKAGGKAILKHVNSSALGALPPAFQSFEYIQNEHVYIAWLANSPFLETGAPGVKERDSLHLVLGYVGEERE